VCSSDLAFVFINAIAGDLLLHFHTGVSANFGDSVLRVFEYILGDTGDSERTHIYGRFVFAVFWLSTALSIIYMLRPALVGRRFTGEEKARARKIVTEYGQNPSSYLALEDDKKLFFSKGAEGVVAYGKVADVMVVDGDPICAPDDFAQVLAEFKAFSADSSSGCIFLGATDVFLDEYRKFGYSSLKCGEEAHFDLCAYKLEGKSTAKLRQNIHHAERDGITVREYKPLAARDPKIEKAIEGISAQWLEGKKSDMLCFTIGGDGLDDPMDRRYFIAEDGNGKIVAYNVCLPYAGMKGYMVDVTRRLNDAPNGVTEMLVVEGFRLLREEGALYGSMALAPLSNVLGDEGKDPLESKLLALMYEHFNRFYGLKDLRRSKEKYGPTSWNPQYFVYSGKRLTPALAYATVAIQNPDGVKGFAKSLLPDRG
jgi:phosphatidylglycerol lysyltransferase